MKKFSVFLIAMSLWLRLAAVPTLPTPLVINQSDGTTITIVMHGDEFHSSFMTDDYLTVGDLVGVINLLLEF